MSVALLKIDISARKPWTSSGFDNDSLDKSNFTVGNIISLYYLLYREDLVPAIREYGSTLYVGLSRFPHRANTNRFRYNSLASEHFCPKF